MQNVTREIVDTVASNGPFAATLERIMRIVFANFVQTFSYFNTASNFGPWRHGFDTLKRKELMEQFHEIMAQGVHAVEELLRRSRKAGEIVSDQEPAELSWYCFADPGRSDARVDVQQGM